MPLKALRMLVLVLPCVLALGCTCIRLNVDSTFELRDDEVDLTCEEVCLESVDDGYELDACAFSGAGVDPPTVTCHFSRESCSPQSDHF